MVEALQSLVDQNYPRLEIVVMDGGSKDESLKVIQSFSKYLTHWQSEPDSGQAAAVNDGLRRMRGDIVGWLNADDQLLPGALWRVAHAWVRQPGRGLYLGNGLRRRENSDSSQPFLRRHLALNRRALALGIDYVLQPATFFSGTAWDESGGLREDLRYGMDWDMVQRVASRHSAVLINEFLAMSREHEETKTRTGGRARVEELAAIARAHSGGALTPGAVHYELESQLSSLGSDGETKARRDAERSFAKVHEALREIAGNADGFPERGDGQDVVDLPFVDPSWPCPNAGVAADLPLISVVMPSFNHAAFLSRAIESVLTQGYPNVETLVFDAGSSDGTREVLRQYEERLTRCVIEKDRGPAHAINKGFAAAQGEVLGWLCADDLLAHGALSEIGRAFADDPALDLVYANALYIDANDQMTLADHGRVKTGLYYGEVQPADRVHRYWEYVHALPQPTVFFRRRLLDACGPLDESYQYIFDFELFARMTRRAKVRKIEMTLGFYRLHAGGKSADWRRFLVELYRFSRPRWPKAFSSAFVDTWVSFIKETTRRRTGRSVRDPRAWPAAALLAASSLARNLNPEAGPFAGFRR